jgi:ATP adenylyltransferase
MKLYSILMENKILWAPWRSSFILGEKEKGCPLCKAFRAKEDSVENLVVYRGKTCLVILNKYPYNAGHAMISPNRHVRSLERLTQTENDELFELTRTTVKVIKRTIRPHSLNLGMNLGASSGAGIPEHLHLHVVPRWNGDTSFMYVIGETKLVSIPLEPVYEAMRKSFSRL